MRDNIIATLLIALMLWPVSAAPLSAQDLGALPFSELRDSPQAAFAMTLQDYPATPGDVYELIFRSDRGMYRAQFVVEHDYQLQLDLFGTLNVRGMSFPEIRDQVRARVTRQYRNSYPRLAIVRVGEFQVYLSGEVRETGWQRVDALSRLQDVVEERATEYASLRQVVVHDDRGESRRYDLFAAARRGQPEQNPYVRPGDRIELSRAERQVDLSGEVHRPGRYELLPGERLGELIERYGGGFTRNADRERVVVRRVPDQLDRASERLRVDFRSAGGPDTALRDQDAVTVPTREEFLPVVFFEGAVRSDGPGGETAGDLRDGERASELQYARFAYRFDEGERLSEAALAVEDEFRGAADLREAYIVHSGMGGVRRVNLEELLYRGSIEQDMELSDGDRIVIPFQQRFVTVTGAVNNPGLFRYVQGRTFEYYLDLAGGTNIDQTWVRRPRIRGRDGERRSRSEEIRPEDRIHMRRVSPALYLGIAGTMAASFLAIWALLDTDRSPIPLD